MTTSPTKILRDALQQIADGDVMSDRIGFSHRDTVLTYQALAAAALAAPILPVAGEGELPDIDAAFADVERRLTNIWDDANVEWGDAVGGPQAHQIYAQRILSAARDELAAIAQRAPVEAPGGEVAEHQYRTRADWHKNWSEWEKCTEASYNDYVRVPLLHDWHYEVRKLYAIESAPAHNVAAAEVLLAGVQALCVSAEQEWNRHGGNLREWEKGWIGGQLHIFDMYTSVDKAAIAQAREFTRKLHIPAPAPVASEPSLDGSPINEGTIPATPPAQESGELAKLREDAARYQYLIDQLPCSIADDLECGISEIGEMIDQAIADLALSRTDFLDKHRAALPQDLNAEKGPAA